MTPIHVICDGGVAILEYAREAPNGGEPAAIFCFVFLYMAARGSGIWSVEGESAA